VYRSRFARIVLKLCHLATGQSWANAIAFCQNSDLVCARLESTSAFPADLRVSSA